MLGIPTAFAMFFAWTKTRAMQKLQQTQQQAAEQFNQLRGETVEQQKGFTQQIGTYQTQLSTQQQQIQSLQSQLANAPNNQTYMSLQTNYQKLQNDYNTMEATYQNLIHELKQKTQTIIK